MVFLQEDGPPLQRSPVLKHNGKSGTVWTTNNEIVSHKFQRL
jgi:pyridoxine/pyridoxamine 5'-phosphate oxidase